VGQLSAYLLTDGLSSGYCGQNDPDARLELLALGVDDHYTVTGFRVYRLPCASRDRVMLHMRNNGLLIPPTPTETVAEATFPVNFEILR